MKLNSFNILSYIILFLIFHKITSKWNMQKIIFKLLNLKYILTKMFLSQTFVIFNDFSDKFLKTWKLKYLTWTTNQLKLNIFHKYYGKFGKSIISQYVYFLSANTILIYLNLCLLSSSSWNERWAKFVTPILSIFAFAGAVQMVLNVLHIVSTNEGISVVKYMKFIILLSCLHFNL